MSWMFRWLERLVGHLRSSEGADPKWVEPSNAITRAILAGAAAQLSAKPIQASVATSEAVVAPAAAPEVTHAPEVAQPEETLERPAAAVTVTRTAQRSRRRRASRAA